MLSVLREVGLATETPSEVKRRGWGRGGYVVFISVHTTDFAAGVTRTTMTTTSTVTANSATTLALGSHP